MFYIVVIAVVLFALYLIFKDDHDRSYNQAKYNKKEKSAPQPPVVQKPDPVEELEEPVKEELIEEELDLSFLDTLDYYEFLDENTETFDIDEVQDFCNLYDAGTIVGVVKPETWSLIPRPGAKAIFDHEGGRLGFIPSTQLKWYNEFNQQEVVCPFVGRIDIDRNGGLVGEIKAIIPTSREFVEKEIRAGLQ